MAEDNIYFLATSQSETGEVTLLHGSPRMVNLQMQAKFHPAVLPSQNSLLPATQKGNRMHGDLPRALSCLGPEVIFTSAQTNFKRGWENVIFTEQSNLCHARFIYFS